MPLWSFTTPAADGIPALRLMRQAARRHHLDLPDPHAHLGAIDRITHLLEGCGLRIDRIERRSFPDLLQIDADTAWDHVLDYGFADQLRQAPPRLQAAIRGTYRQAYATTRADGTAEQPIMITKCCFATS